MRTAVFSILIAVLGYSATGCYLHEHRYDRHGERARHDRYDRDGDHHHRHYGYDG
jgi:hypothetical protein